MLCTQSHFMMVYSIHRKYSDKQKQAKCTQITHDDRYQAGSTNNCFSPESAVDHVGKDTQEVGITWEH